MTNRDSLFQKMAAMDDDALAEYLEGDIGEDVSLQICIECQCAHDGTCLADTLRLDQCPRRTSDWLHEEKAG